MNIVIDSTFKPFTLNDLLAPVDRYNEAYDKLEAEYSDLVTQTEAWKDIANRENSPEAYAMYKNYSDQLNAIVDDFSQGMTMNNRRQLLGMKRRYASDITPIANASEAMKVANALRDQLGSDAIFEVGRYNSLDDFLHGKTANNKYESRKDIAARTAAMSQAVAQSIIDDPIIRDSMNPQFLEIIQKRGIGSLDELQAAIAGNPAAMNRFAQIRESMIDQIGGLDRFDAQGRSAIEGAINEGLYAGLNNYQTSLQQDANFISDYQRTQLGMQQQELNMRRAEHNLKMDEARLTMNQRSGKAPVEIRPDGTRVYLTGTGATWTETPKQDSYKLENGRTRYRYKDENGRIYTSDKAGKKTITIDGKTIKVTPVIKGYTTSAVSQISSGNKENNEENNNTNVPENTLGATKKAPKIMPIYFDAFWNNMSDGIQPFAYGKTNSGVYDADVIFDLEQFLFENERYMDKGEEKRNEKARGQIKKLIETFNKQNKTNYGIEDFLLHKDNDVDSDSHYRLVPKGYIVNDDGYLEYSPQDRRAKPTYKREFEYKKWRPQAFDYSSTPI